MEKRHYITPEIKEIKIESANLMLTTSPGVSDTGYDPNGPFESRQRTYTDIDDGNDSEPWGHSPWGN